MSKLSMLEERISGVDLDEQETTTDQEEKESLEIIEESNE